MGERRFEIQFRQEKKSQINVPGHKHTSPRRSQSNRFSPRIACSANRHFMFFQREKRNFHFRSAPIVEALGIWRSLLSFLLSNASLTLRSYSWQRFHCQRLRKKRNFRLAKANNQTLSAECCWVVRRELSAFLVGWSSALSSFAHQSDSSDHWMKRIAREPFTIAITAWRQSRAFFDFSSLC